MRKRTIILVNLFIVVLLLTATVIRDGKLFGKKVEKLFTFGDPIEIVAPNANELKQLGIVTVIAQVSEGVWKAGTKQIYSTQRESLNHFGFSGPVPAFVLVNNQNVIEKVILGQHDETESYVDNALEKGLLTQWIGVKTDNIGAKKVDAISSATYTSNAVNNALISTFSGSLGTGGLGTNHLVAILVLVWGVIASFIHKRSRHLRTITLLSNTVVLGLWCGSFLSISTFQGWLKNGIAFSNNPAIAVMLIVVLIMTVLLTKKAYYCTWVCPFGALQELLGKISKKKIPIKGKLAKILNHSRVTITMLMLVSMWLGTALAIAEYEVFAAFMISSASIFVLILAIISSIMAIFIPKPYCRFICPTGQLLTWTNKLN